MSYIDPDGMFNGDRMGLLSDDAKLFWPYFWCASNTVGRIELNFRKVLGRAFHHFKAPPTEHQFWTWLREYRDAHLLFIYKNQEAVWGQWDVQKRFLPQYSTAADKRTPEPPLEDFQKWREAYLSSKKEQSSNSIANQMFTNLSQVYKDLEEVSEKTSQEFCIGKGIGIGIGIGKGEEPPLPPVAHEGTNAIGFLDPRAGFDFDAWFEDQFRRHPNKKFRQQAHSVLGVMREVLDEAWRREFERVHELWLADENWKWKNGAKVPTFVEWVIDKGWRYEPTPSTGAEDDYISATEEMT